MEDGEVLVGQRLAAGQLNAVRASRRAGRTGPEADQRSANVVVFAGFPQMVVGIHDRLQPILAERQASDVDLLAGSCGFVDVLPADRDALGCAAAKTTGFLRGIGQTQIIRSDIHQTEAGLLATCNNRPDFGHTVAVAVGQGLAQ